MSKSNVKEMRRPPVIRGVPKCKHCGAKPMMCYVAEQVLNRPDGGTLKVLITACVGCDTTLSTDLVIPNPNVREVQTPSGLIVPR